MRSDIPPVAKHTPGRTVCLFGILSFEVKSNVSLLSPFWDNPALGSACAAPLLPAAHAQDPSLRRLRPLSRPAETGAEGCGHGSAGTGGQTRQAAVLRRQVRTWRTAHRCDRIHRNSPSDGTRS